MTRPDARTVHAFMALMAVFVLLPCAGLFAQPTIDELLDIAPPAEAPADAEPPAVPIDPEIARKLTGEEAADAFAQVLAEMDQVAQRLGQSQDAGLETQRMQEAILRKLEMVIDASQSSQSSSSSSGSSGSSDSQPQQQDTGSAQNEPQDAGQSQPQPSAAAGQGDNQGGDTPAGAEPDADRTGLLDEGRREWGHLPPRLRDELIQGLNERFSPVYRAMTEAYYERLAQEDE